jgi:hypothetical protein
VRTLEERRRHRCVGVLLWRLAGCASQRQASRCALSTPWRSASATPTWCTPAPLMSRTHARTHARTRRREKNRLAAQRSRARKMAQLDALSAALDASHARCVRACVCVCVCVCVCATRV